jgi:predicted DsbA family dithiol-disulfide isomerase
MSFFLNPGSTPEEGEDLKEHLVKKYGAAAVAGFNSPDSHLNKAGRRVGINFNSTRKVIPTLRCHALMEITKEKFGNEKGNLLMEAMFVRYFEKAENVHTVPKLKEIYSELGLTWSDEIDEALGKDSNYSKRVIEGDRMVKSQLRVSGVPFFIFDRNDGSRPVALSGAQPAEVLREALEEASA